MNKIGSTSAVFHIVVVGIGFMVLLCWWASLLADPSTRLYDLGLHNKDKSNAEEFGTGNKPIITAWMGQKLKHLNYSAPVIESKSSDLDADLVFHKYILQKHIWCPKFVRLGIMDGMWPACTVGNYRPKRPCLIYSFGIGFDWSFDDHAARRFGCEVHGFDPSLGIGSHKRSKLVNFHATGIGGSNRTVARGWPLLTLDSHRRLLGHQNKTVDYLKIDVEYSEWETLENILADPDSIIHKTKQLALEVHSVLDIKPHSKKFIYYQNLLMKLENLGYRKWYSHVNPTGVRKTGYKGVYTSCCYEIVYLNMRYTQEVTDMDERDHSQIK